MIREEIIHILQEKTEAILKEQQQHFLVDIKIKPTNNIKIFIDGDNGIGIDELIRYNRSLYKILEEEAMFPDGDFSLEVSSPGLSEPLKLHRQYIKNKGRDVEVVLQDGSKINGTLAEVSDDNILVEEVKGKGKKAETIQHVILFNNIKTTTVQIKF